MYTIVYQYYPTKEEHLNKRSKLIAKCRHMNKFMLANYISKDWFYYPLLFCSLNRFWLLFLSLT